MLMPRMMTSIGELDSSDDCNEGVVEDVPVCQCRAY